MGFSRASVQLCALMGFKHIQIKGLKYFMTCFSSNTQATFFFVLFFYLVWKIVSFIPLMILLWVVSSRQESTGVHPAPSWLLSAVGHRSPAAHRWRSPHQRTASTGPRSSGLIPPFPGSLHPVQSQITHSSSPSCENSLTFSLCSWTKLFFPLSYLTLWSEFVAIFYKHRTCLVLGNWIKKNFSINFL